jgi:hypothetical protein
MFHLDFMSLMFHPDFVSLIIHLDFVSLMFHLDFVSLMFHLDFVSIMFHLLCICVNANVIRTFYRNFIANSLHTYLISINLKALKLHLGLSARFFMLIFSESP